MKAISELRNGERFYAEAPVLVEDNRTGYRYDGTMFNYSKSGMYLETDYAPRPKRKIRIKVNNLPGSSSPRKYLAEVRWRQPLPDKGASYSFGIGVKYD
ncbi:MAG: PilZ domain-containing protein [Desulfobacterales bacterium]